MNADLKKVPCEKTLLFVSTYVTPRLQRQTRPGDIWLEHGSILALLGRATAVHDSSSSEYGYNC